MPRPGTTAIVRILAVAAAYLVAGKLALLMAIPPGYATAVWPAAGIALVAVLLYGPAVAPGVLVGSFFVNLGTSLDASSAAAIARSAGIACGIGAGAALQALAAASLVRRFVGFPTTLSRVADVGAFLFLAGPVGCVVNATLGVALLAGLAVISPSQLAFSWWTWWVGDTIGVLLVTPLALIWNAEPREVWRRRRRSVGVPLVLCAALVITLFLFASAREAQLLRGDFELRTDRFATAIKANLASYAEAIRSIADAIEVNEATNEAINEATNEATNKAIDGAAFRGLVARPLARHPGIAALSWNPLVPEGDRAAFEARVGFPIVERAGGEIAPARPRPAYVPVAWIEPADRNRRALGFDLMSDPTRREAAERARRTGEVAVSARLELIQDAEAQPAVLVLAPVGPGRAGPGGVRGFIVAVLRIPDAVRTSLRDFELGGIDLQLRDATAADGGGAPLCSLRSGPPAELASAGEPEVEAGFELGGRRWELWFAPSPAYASTHRSWQAWTVFALGLLFTSLLGAFLLVVTGRAASVDQLVEQQTRELTQSLREKEVLIKEVHHRVKNNLQVISSIINMQARELGGGDRDAERNALRECQSRVQAIALVHEKLYQTGAYAGVPFASYARSLADNVFEANGVSPSEVALQVAIDEIDLSVDRAVPCALILNELISNALKHAFTAGQRGTIRVMLTRVDAGACLAVVDDGQGLPEGLDPAQGKSLGMKLVRALARQLHGELEVGSGAGGAGVTVRVTFPV